MINKKHYTYSDKLAIETMLDEGKSIKEISNDIKKSSSNIIREIKKHVIFKFSSIYNHSYPCLKWDTCSVKGFECYKTCKNIKFNLCPKLEKSPHVCNGCTSKNGCRYVKMFYKAREAHDSYKETLTNSRIGLHYSEHELLILNERLCPLIISSKSVYHAVTTINNVFELSFNKDTIYKQIERKQLPIKSSDLPRTRRKNKTESKDKNYKRNIEGHTYEDYRKYKDDNPNANEMQMDTVEGIKENNAPVLLTLEIVEINFLFMFKIDSQTIDDVTKKLSYFKDIIGIDIFDKIMEILLTDNGKEFINVEKIIEVSSNINIFYCHPYSSYEKGSIENNHEFIRRVIPKGVSLKPYTQKEFNLLCSHINSLYRESLDGKCPFDLIENFIPIEKINEMGLSKINPLNISLIPELLGEKNINNIKKYLDYEDIRKANISIENGNQ